ncbi:chaperone modulator CbpM [Roseomonas harenae]|jgi:chaperone modulatory protein CbpM|uniref:chaperone modulator CbpM n=1 Tax=Muricoccus harenae TaxID=2692566 RepID=UPI0013313DAC|nr:chaperone modulator CbpM [Roseomonas harenae]
MIGLEAVLHRVSGLDEARLNAWIEEGWVRPERQADGFVFQEIDIARCQLILELRDELEVDEAAMPVVLTLLDQLHQTRRQLRRVAEALEQARANRGA